MTRKEIAKLDKLFLAWVEDQPSCVSGDYDTYLDNGDKKNCACHVRRAKHSGIAEKPKFHAVAMTSEEHNYQHQHGELVCLIRFHSFFLANQTKEDAKDWFDNQVKKHQRRFMDKTGLTIPSEYL